MQSFRDNIERMTRETKEREERTRVDTRQPLIGQFRDMQPHVPFPLAVPTETLGLVGGLTPLSGPMHAPIVLAILGRRGVRPLVGLTFTQTTSIPPGKRIHRPSPESIPHDRPVRGHEATLYLDHIAGEEHPALRLVWQEEDRTYWFDSRGLAVEEVLRAADSVRRLDELDAAHVPSGIA